MKLNKLRNEGASYAVFCVCNSIFMCLIIAVTFLPYLNVLVKALNDGTDSLRGGITFWPRVFTFDNFNILFKDVSIYRAALVSVMRVIVSVVLSIMVQFMAAYALSRPDLKYKKFINTFFLVPMFVSGGLIPQYILFSNINLLDNFLVYILPCAFSFYNVIIIRSYISMSISDSIIEAARIDGAKEWTLFAKIVMPLSKPILATIALWTAVYAWNDWSTTLYYIQKSSLHTMQYKLMQTIKETERMQALIQASIENGQNVETLQKSMKVTPDSVISAQVIVVTLPIIMVYPFLQKYFVKGIMIGAVKG